MTPGFSFIAHPTEYRKSGVMTFLINPEGVTYQCDLGDNAPDSRNSYTPSSPTAPGSLFN